MKSEINAFSNARCMRERSRSDKRTNMIWQPSRGMTSKQTSNRCLKESLPQGSSAERHQTCESESAKLHAICECSMIDKSINQETISRQPYHEKHRARRSKPGAPIETSVRFTCNASGMMRQQSKYKQHIKIK